MSKYTTELRFICESLTGLSESKGYNSVNDIIKAAAPKIFSFDFPIYDENHRLDLECLIIKHYYLREIGEETFGAWQLKLDDKLNMIMGKYNQMYELADKKKTVDLFDDVDYTREGNKAGTNSFNNNSSANSSGSAGSVDAFSDTPQGALTDALSMDYLTNVRKVDGTNTGSESRTEAHSGNDAEEYRERVYGKQGGGSYLSLFREARDAIIDIDDLIVQECADLFINIY